MSRRRRFLMSSLEDLFSKPTSAGKDWNPWTLTSHWILVRREREREGNKSETERGKGREGKKDGAGRGRGREEKWESWRKSPKERKVMKVCLRNKPSCDNFSLLSSPRSRHGTRETGSHLPGKDHEPLRCAALFPSLPSGRARTVHHPSRTRLQPQSLR